MIHNSPEKAFNKISKYAFLHSETLVFKHNTRQYFGLLSCCLRCGLSVKVSKHMTKMMLPNSHKCNPTSFPNDTVVCKTRDATTSRDIKCGGIYVWQWAQTQPIENQRRKRGVERECKYEIKVKQYLFWRSPSPPPSSETSLQLQLRLQRHTQSALAKENSASAIRHSSSHSRTLYPSKLRICRDLPLSRPSFPSASLTSELDFGLASLTAFPPLFSLDTANSLTSLSLSQSADLNQTVEEYRSTTLLGLRPTHTHILAHPYH